MIKNNVTLSNIFDELPIQVHNSHLVTALLHDLDSPVADANRLPSLTTFTSTQKTATLAEDNAPLAPNLEVLDLELDPFMQKNLENLLDCADAQQQEHNNYQYWQRSVAREQVKIQAWLTKRVSIVRLTNKKVDVMQYIQMANRNYKIPCYDLIETRKRTARPKRSATTS
jgi:hypothetical protein